MPKVALVAHRGGSREAPENTLAAFRLAWQAGADGIEADFRLTRDGEIVCMHDATTSRTADVDLAVADSTLTQLRDLDVGRWKGEKWRGERVPTLRQVIGTVPHGKKLFIELKSGPAILPPLASILSDSGLGPQQVILLAFSEEVIAEARECLPHVRALWITDYTRRSGGWTPTIEVILQTLERVGASGLASQAHRSIDVSFVRSLHEAGREFHVWTVNDFRSAVHFLELGANSIITDRPEWLRGKLQSCPHNK